MKLEDKRRLSFHGGGVPLLGTGSRQGGKAFHAMRLVEHPRDGLKRPFAPSNFSFSASLAERMQVRLW